MSAASEPSPKVIAAAGGGGLGVAVATILVWILTANGVTVPAEAGTAIGAVISSVLAAVAGWAKRDSLRDAGAEMVDGAEGP